MPSSRWRRKEAPYRFRKGLSLAEAAALPETVFTVWHNVFERGGLERGEWLLVHGGASGIGTTAIQMATALGAKVMVTVGSDEKARACEALGAARAINYREEDFVEAVREATGGNGANVILDMVGGDYVERDLRAAALEGHIVQIAFLKGSKVELDLMRLMMRRLTLTGSTLRAQSPEAKTRMAKAIEQRVWPLIAVGKVKPVVDSTFDLAQASEAHRRIDDPDHVGKIVLITKEIRLLGNCLEKRQALYRLAFPFISLDWLFRRRGRKAATILLRSETHGPYPLNAQSDCRLAGRQHLAHLRADRRILRAARA